MKIGDTVYNWHFGAMKILEEDEGYIVTDKGKYTHSWQKAGFGAFYFDDPVKAITDIHFNDSDIPQGELVENVEMTNDKGEAVRKDSFAIVAPFEKVLKINGKNMDEELIKLNGEKLYPELEEAKNQISPYEKPLVAARCKLEATISDVADEENKWADGYNNALVQVNEIYSKINAMIEKDKEGKKHKLTLLDLTTVDKMDAVSDTTKILKDLSIVKQQYDKMEKARRADDKKWQDEAEKEAIENVLKKQTGDTEEFKDIKDEFESNIANLEDAFINLEEQSAPSFTDWENAIKADADSVETAKKLFKKVAEKVLKMPVFAFPDQVKNAVFNIPADLCKIIDDIQQEKEKIEKEMQ